MHGVCYRCFLKKTSFKFRMESLWASMVFLCFFRSEVAEVHFDQRWPRGGARTVAQQLFAELQCQGVYQKTVCHSEIRRYRSPWHRLELPIILWERNPIDWPSYTGSSFSMFSVLYCIQPMGVVSLSWLSSRSLSGVLRASGCLHDLQPHEP